MTTQPDSLSLETNLIAEDLINITIFLMQCNCKRANVLAAARARLQTRTHVSNKANFKLAIICSAHIFNRLTRNEQKG